MKDVSGGAPLHSASQWIPRSKTAGPPANWSFVIRPFCSCHGRWTARSGNPTVPAEAASGCRHIYEIAIVGISWFFPSVDRIRPPSQLPVSRDVPMVLPASAPVPSGSPALFCLCCECDVSASALAAVCCKVLIDVELAVLSVAYEMISNQNLHMWSVFSFCL